MSLKSLNDSDLAVFFIKNNILLKMLETNIIVRKFKRPDRESIRSISCNTAFLELPVEKFIKDREILADVLTEYYTDYEPGSCFVAVKNSNVIGYIIGTRDIKLMNKIFKMKILPRLIIKSLRTGVFLRRNSLQFFLHLLISFFKGEFYIPDFSRHYPATLHINVDKNFRRHKVGKSLMEHYMSFLTENRVQGVHFGTISEEAKLFFTKFGFQILFESKRSYLEYVIGKIAPYYIFGKEIK